MKIKINISHKENFFFQKFITLLFSGIYLVFSFSFDKKWQIINCIGIFHSRKVFNISRKKFLPEFYKINFS
jgi:hypothetical protein